MERKHWVRGAIALAALGIGGFAIRARLQGDARAAGPGAAASAAAGDRVVPVVAVTVEQRDVAITLEGLGSVAAFNTVTVKTQVDGRLVQVAFREGQEVHKGDLLAQIDPRPFQIQLHQAEAALARDRAQLSGVQTNLERVKGLRGDGLASQQQIDDLRASAAQWQGTLRADQAQIEAARLSLDYARITAPIDGVTGVRLVDAGNVVRASDATGIVVIAQVDPIAVLFTLPQDDLPRITKAMAEGTLHVDAMSRDGETKLGAGELALVDNQINQTTATIRLKAIFPNAGRALWPNQFVKARLYLTTRKGAKVVPAAVTQRGPQGTFAYVIGPDQKVSVRPIQIETTVGDQAIIAGGLEAGEQVVVEGQYQLRPGSRVTQKPSPGAPAKHAKGAPSAATPAKSAAPNAPASGPR